jgi:hypothetical protein
MFQSGHRRYDQTKGDGEYNNIGEDNYRYVLNDYSKIPPKPTSDGEPSYENIPQGLPDTTMTEMRSGDIINKFYDTPITLENAQTAFMMLHGKKPGDEIKLVLTRDEKDFNVLWKLPPAKRKLFMKYPHFPSPCSLL